MGWKTRSLPPPMRAHEPCATSQPGAHTYLIIFCAAAQDTPALLQLPPSLLLHRLPRIVVSSWMCFVPRLTAGVLASPLCGGGRLWFVLAAILVVCWSGEMAAVLWTAAFVCALVSQVSGFGVSFVVRLDLRSADGSVRPVLVAVCGYSCPRPVFLVWVLAFLPRGTPGRVGGFPSLLRGSVVTCAVSVLPAPAGTGSGPPGGWALFLLCCTPWVPCRRSLLLSWRLLGCVPRFPFLLRFAQRWCGLAHPLRSVRSRPRQVGPARPLVRPYAFF